MSEITDTLMDQVEAFLRRHRMSPTRLGIEFANDGHFVHRLRNGMSMRVSTADRLLAWMAERNAEAEQTNAA